MLKIMIVEDEDDVRNTYVRFLLRRGYDAKGARDGLSAIKLFEEYRPDMVFIDFFIPELRGDKVLFAIRKIDPNVKVFFVTGSRAKIEELQEKKVPANGFILKPLWFDEFQKIIEDNK